MIAVILPTRGLVFAEVENMLELMRQYLPQTLVLRSWDKTLPDAQNYLVDAALKVDDVTHLLFIEEDTVMPHPEEGILKMIQANADIACIDYGVSGWSCTARDKKTDEILWCGFGCTLVKREVIEALEAPWFRTDKSLRINDWQWIDNPSKYGGQDIWFCEKAREKGFKIVQVAGECKHLELKAVGQKGVNSGLHLIGEKLKIEKQQIIERPEEVK